MYPGEGESAIRVTANSEQARRLLTDLAENADVRNRLTNRESAAETLREYDIEISDDLVPPEPMLPEPEQIREALKAIDSGAMMPPPYAAFRPPWCMEGVEKPPPYGSIFSVIFNLVERRVKPSEES